MKAFNSGRLSRHFNPPPEREQVRDSSDLDIPVDSWDAYKTWCDKVRDNWNDEDDQTNQWCG